MVVRDVTKKSRDSSSLIAHRRREGSAVAIDEAYIDDESKKLIISLSNGVVCAVPQYCLAALATVWRSGPGEMVIAEGGVGLKWPRLDVELSLAEIISATMIE
jgi:hypothetical protein